MRLGEEDKAKKKDLTVNVSVDDKDQILNLQYKRGDSRSQEKT